MRKHLLILLMLTAGLVNAQQSVPNGNFEQWSSFQFERPGFFPFTSNMDAYRRGLPFNCTKTTDAYHGSYAMKLLTVASSKDSLFGYFVNGQPEDDPMAWHGGSAYAQQATGFRGYYKSNVPAGDTAVLIIAFSKAGVNIGTYFYVFTGQQSSYQLFNFNFAPALSQVPDSVMLAAASSNPGSGQSGQSGYPGSMLQLDSIAFTGVSSQPAGFDGSFEQWVTEIAEIPTKWYMGDSRTLVSYKTSTAYKGSFAVKLESRQDFGDNGVGIVAHPDNVSTGYYEPDCNQCIQQGGYPFSRQADTLVFWYKYAAAGGSKAAVIVDMKKNGGIVGGNYLELDAAANYQRMELPINSSQVPDTLIVRFQASRWNDSLPTHIGAVLYVDEVQLKSAPLNTGVQGLRMAELVQLYPNPAHAALHVLLPASISGASLEVFNIMGQLMLQTELAGSKTEIDVQALPAGIYFCKVSSQAGTQVSRVVIE